MYQMNVHVGRIPRHQATMGGFAPKATPSPPFLDSDDDDGDDDDAFDDGDASSTNEISTWYSYPLSLVTKNGSCFEYESSLS